MRSQSKTLPSHFQKSACWFISAVIYTDKYELLPFYNLSSLLFPCKIGDLVLVSPIWSNRLLSLSFCFVEQPRCFILNTVWETVLTFWTKNIWFFRAEERNRLYQSPVWYNIHHRVGNPLIWGTFWYQMSCARLNRLTEVGSRRIFYHEIHLYFCSKFSFVILCNDLINLNFSWPFLSVIAPLAYLGTVARSEQWTCDL